MAKNQASNIRKPVKQRDGRPPVVDNPDKPEMQAVKPRRIGRRIVTMAADPEPTKPKGNLMDPMPKKRPRTSSAAASGPGDQVPIEGGDQYAAAPGKGYVTLRIRATGGELELRAVNFVEGPLRQDEAVSPGLTYEASFGRRRVGFGDVPESTEWRSFPDPDGSGERRGHHHTKRDSFHFTVRIPAEEFDEASLDDLRVTLYRWRGRGPGEHIAMSDLAAEPKAAVETIATMRGLSVEELPSALQQDLRTTIDKATS